jgi:DNA-binding MarR family transcriptional regulator
MMESHRDAPGEVEQLAARLRALAIQGQDAWLDLDLTLPQLRALFVVRQRQPLTVSDLASALGQRLAAVSALVTRLARAGLLRRSEDPNDRRRVRLELTHHAERLLAAVDDRSAARFAAILGQMSPQGRHALAMALDELLRLLHDATDQHAQPGPRRHRKGS